MTRTPAASASPSGCSRSCPISCGAASRLCPRVRAPSAVPRVSAPSTRSAAAPSPSPPGCCASSSPDLMQSLDDLRRIIRRIETHRAAPRTAPELIERAGALVTFNGGGFDLPLLETRFVLARRRWPAMLPHLDLLRPSRRMWTGCLDDCRLATLERDVLGLAREQDVPGGLIPTLYFDWLRRRRAAPMARIFAHNRDDVLSLAALVGWFGAALGEAPTLRAEEWAGLGRLWEPVDLERGLGCYRAALAAGLRDDAAHWGQLRLAWWEKRAAPWATACPVWEAARQRELFDPRPWEELAKFHDHRARDFAAARAVVSDALSLARAAGVAERVLDGFAYRLARIERRLTT